jgi:hypothetical protein
VSYAKSDVICREWQPIETAPHMKTILLFAVTYIGDDGAIRNWKMSTGFFHTGYAVLRDNKSPWNWEGRQLATYEIHPTHWMSLPEPPVTP